MTYKEVLAIDDINIRYEWLNKNQKEILESQRKGFEEREEKLGGIK